MEQNGMEQNGMGQTPAAVTGAGLRVPYDGMLSGEQVASTLACFATVVTDKAWMELDAC